MKQRAVAKLEMSGKEEHAVAKLEKALEKMKEENKQLEAYETDMLLVEMLIYKVFISYPPSFFTPKAV